MKRFVYIFFLLLSISANGQTAQQADALFGKQAYQQAQEAYRHLLKKSPSNPLYLYRAARCAYELGEAEEAIRLFEQAGEKYALRNYYLGELYFQQYHFTEAFAAYERYAESIDSTNARYAYLQEQLLRAEKGERYIRRVEDLQIIDSITLPKQEFLQAYQLTPEAGTLTNNNGNITYINQRNDRKLIVSDTATHKDIYACQRLLDTWAECMALPNSVNSLFNENFPFMLTDGITLYFGSDRPDGLGGYDIYITRYNSTTDTYLTPENIGMPFNSFANDYMLAIDENSNIGYFATDRHGGADRVTVYTFVPNSEKRILRNQPDEYIRLAAQLKAYHTAEVETDLPVRQEEDNTEEQQDFLLIINDTTLYQHWDDFLSQDARALYKTYRQTARQQQRNIATLSDLRKDYSTATTERQEAIGSRILQLEQSLPQQGKVLAAMLNQVRQLEQKAIATPLATKADE